MFAAPPIAYRLSPKLSTEALALGRVLPGSLVDSAREAVGSCTLNRHYHKLARARQDLVGVVRHATVERPNDFGQDRQGRVAFQLARVQLVGEHVQLANGGFIEPIEAVALGHHANQAPPARCSSTRASMPSASAT